MSKPRRQRQLHTEGDRPASGSADALESSTDDEPTEESSHRQSRRSSPWNQRRDRIAAAVIAVVCLAASVLVWGFSDSRATTAEHASGPAPELQQAPSEVPGSLKEIWLARSPATSQPVAAGRSVITGEGGEVTGRDPMTGAARWRYSRDIPLCTVGNAWSKANAVYRKGNGCSEVTQLDPATGARTAARNSDTGLGTRIVDGGQHALATGSALLNVWRNDLVKDAEYGKVPTTVEPNKQPRTGCSYGSTAISGDRVGVIERCPEDPTDRLTVFKTKGEHEYEPDVVFSTLLAGHSAKLIAMSGGKAAVALPEQRLLVLYGPDGSQQSAYPLDLPQTDLGDDPEGQVVPTVTARQSIYWFTGSATMALSRRDLTPQWTLKGTQGPGTLFAKQLVVPINGGLAVLDEHTGATLRTVGVDRHNYSGPVELTSLGPVLLEQRGQTVTALE